MKREELERLYSVSAQLKKGLENISTGRVEAGKAWVEEASGALNILLRLVESENTRGRLDNE
ncbi:hypothetical protein AA471_27475 [Salmonella enterica subsp. enterica]|nr:hypothetical protein [Salmonella enterica subsp. enterica]ECI0980937.1 hypothetical protein [Salmonella enterica subsp. enterica serovar Newport]ECO0902312.1 hypothetical protein [Salmonella enterica subsp. enterica serovar Newport]ECO1013836.1 hypothetical protein [Salmonella enterica subsp. enterica serovar Newport]EDQ2991812.1 hypothetical protein [Salmonella enterica subsp. enterica]